MTLHLRLVVVALAAITCSPVALHAQQASDGLRLEDLIPIKKGDAFFAGSGTAQFSKNGWVSKAMKAAGFAIASYRPVERPADAKGGIKATTSYYQPIGAGVVLGSDKVAQIKIHNYTTIRYTLYDVKGNVVGTKIVRITNKELKANKGIFPLGVAQEDGYVKVERVDNTGNFSSDPAINLVIGSPSTAETEREALSRDLSVVGNPVEQPAPSNNPSIGARAATLPFQTLKVDEEKPLSRAAVSSSHLRVLHGNSSRLNPVEKTVGHSAVPAAIPVKPLPSPANKSLPIRILFFPSLFLKEGREDAEGEGDGEPGVGGVEAFEVDGDDDDGDDDDGGGGGGGGDGGDGGGDDDGGVGTGDDDDADDDDDDAKPKYYCWWQCVVFPLSDPSDTVVYSSWTTQKCTTDAQCDPPTCDHTSTEGFVSSAECRQFS